MTYAVRNIGGGGFPPKPGRLCQRTAGQGQPLQLPGLFGGGQHLGEHALGFGVTPACIRPDR